MDKSLVMHEIATAEEGELWTEVCENLGHEQMLAIYRLLKLGRAESMMKDFAHHLDPEGADVDHIVTTVKGDKALVRGDLGTYGYWAVLPEELKAEILKDNGYTS